jgi:hypothetical protein
MKGNFFKERRVDLPGLPETRKNEEKTKEGRKEGRNRTEPNRRNS